MRIIILTSENYSLTSKIMSHVNKLNIKLNYSLFVGRYCRHWFDVNEIFSIYTFAFAFNQICVNVVAASELTVYCSLATTTIFRKAFCRTIYEIHRLQHAESAMRINI